MTNSKHPPQKEMTTEEKEEVEHFRKVIAAFKSYKHDSEMRVSKSMQNFQLLPIAHQTILIKHGFKTDLENRKSCIALNYVVLSDIISDAATMFENSSYNGENQGIGPGGDSATAPMDIEKIQSTLKQFVRDWSDTGKEERDASYSPILKELDHLHPIEEGKTRSDIKILVPGAGLGRLAWDIAKKGFECQGNEFSLYMLFGSNFVLNRCKTRNCTEIYPWIHQYCNNFSNEDVISSVTFPDVDPGSLPEDAQFSMVAGDFLEVYNTEEHQTSKDVVVTCFFLDTAHNILDYIELIHKILKPGGHWINLGPLLYHFADIPREPSIEPPYEIVKKLIKSSGFEFLREKVDHEAKYCQNPKSMLQYSYNCIFFTCVKQEA